MLSTMALTQSCRGLPEWWDLRFPLTKNTLYNNTIPQGADMRKKQTLRESGHTGYSLFQVVSGNGKSFPKGTFFYQGKKEINRIDRWDKNVPGKAGS